MRIERHVLFWLFATAAFMATIALLREVLLPFVVGMIIAYFLNPVADRIERLGLPRGAAAGLIVLLGGLLMMLALFLFIPFLSNQVRQMAETMPADIERLKSSVEAWMSTRLGDRYPFFKSGLEKLMGELEQSWSSSIGGFARTLWSKGLAIVNLVSLLLVTPVVVFYLLVDWHPIVAKLDGWLPRKHAETIRRLAGEIDRAVSAFIRGQGTICLILGALYATALTLAGVKYGLLIGISTGLLAFVPYVGWALGLLVALGVTVVQTPEIMPLANVAGIFAAGMAIDTAILSPKIVGEKVGLHPVWLMFALFVFSYLFGFVGVLVAVPVAAAIGVLVRFALELYLGSDVYRGAPAAHRSDLGNS